MQQLKHPPALWITPSGFVSSYPLSTVWFPKAFTAETQRSDASFHPFKRLMNSSEIRFDTLDSLIRKRCWAFGLCYALSLVVSSTTYQTYLHNNINCLQGVHSEILRKIWFAVFCVFLCISGLCPTVNIPFANTCLCALILQILLNCMRRFTPILLKKNSRLRAQEQSLTQLVSPHVVVFYLTMNGHSHRLQISPPPPPVLTNWHCHGNNYCDLNPSCFFVSPCAGNIGSALPLNATTIKQTLQ